MTAEEKITVEYYKKIQSTFWVIYKYTKSLKKLPSASEAIHICCHNRIQCVSFNQRWHSKTSLHFQWDLSIK